MSERYIPSPEGSVRREDEATEEQQLEVLLKGKNIDRYDASTEQVYGTNQRPKLNYIANERMLNIVDDHGHTIETVGTGEVALKYLDEQIRLEHTQSQRFIERLQEIKSRIAQES